MHYRYAVNKAYWFNQFHSRIGEVCVANHLVIFYYIKISGWFIKNLDGPIEKYYSNNIVVSVSKEIFIFNVFNLDT